MGSTFLIQIYSQPQFLIRSRCLIYETRSLHEAQQSVQQTYISNLGQKKSNLIFWKHTMWCCKPLKSQIDLEHSRMTSPPFPPLPPAFFWTPDQDLLVHKIVNNIHLASRVLKLAQVAGTNFNKFKGEILETF